MVEVPLGVIRPSDAHESPWLPSVLPARYIHRFIEDGTERHLRTAEHFQGAKVGP